MQSSSLIFVLVVAIWVAYLLQYWIKRRDHLATVRSVDRFSAAMRVLEHRPTREGGEATPRSYAITPTRAARPTVTVKRAAIPARDAAPGPRAAAPRRVRGLALLGSLALLPVTLLLAAVSPLPWWTSVVVLLAAAGSFVWLRRAVVAERGSAVPRPEVGGRAAGAPRTRIALQPTEDEGGFDDVAVRRPARRASAPFDVRLGETPAAPAPVDTAAPVVDLPPGTWSPTPVPRPTYTMKAPARPAAARPATAGPQVIDDDLDELPSLAPAERRAVGS